MTRAPSIELTLYVHGEELDPQHVSDLTGLEPTRSRRKGDVHVTPTQETVGAKRGFWAYEIGQISDPVEARLSRAVDIVRAAPGLRAIRGCEYVFLDILVLVPANENGGGTFETIVEPPTARTLADLGIPLEVTVAVVRE